MNVSGAPAISCALPWRPLDTNPSPCCQSFNVHNENANVDGITRGRTAAKGLGAVPVQKRALQDISNAPMNQNATLGKKQVSSFAPSLLRTRLSFVRRSGSLPPSCPHHCLELSLQQTSLPPASGRGMPARQTLQQTRTMMGESYTGIGAGMADMAITTPREGVKDIDSCDVNDPLAVVEYLPEIYDHLRAYEVCHLFP